MHWEKHPASVQETPPPRMHPSSSLLPSAHSCQLAAPCKRLFTPWSDPDGSCRASACVLEAGSDAHCPKPSPFLPTSSCPPWLWPRQKENPTLRRLCQKQQKRWLRSRGSAERCKGNSPCTCRRKPALIRCWMGNCCFACWIHPLSKTLCKCCNAVIGTVQSTHETALWGSTVRWEHGVRFCSAARVGSTGSGDQGKLLAGLGLCGVPPAQKHPGAILAMLDGSGRLLWCCSHLR